MRAFLNIALSSSNTNVLRLDSAPYEPEKRFAARFFLLNRSNKEVSGWL
jgi:hypothetical protein